MADEIEDTVQDAVSGASPPTDVHKGAQEIGDVVADFATDQFDQTKEAAQWVGDQLGAAGQWLGKRIERVSPHLAADAKLLAAIPHLMKIWQSGAIRNAVDGWSSIIKLFGDVKTNLIDRISNGDLAAQLQLEQLESGITRAKKNLEKAQQGTGGPTRMDALAQDPAVVTEQVAQDLEDPELATRPQGTLEGEALEAPHGWDSIVGRASFTYRENPNESERAEKPYEFSVADIARNPGNVRPTGNWGVESGAVDPKSELGQALLNAETSGGRSYFIGSAKNGRPVSIDDDRAVVLLKTPNGNYLVFNDYKDGIKVQVENITRQVVGRELDTVDKLVDRWAPKFKADNTTIENTDEERQDYKDNIEGAFEDFGLELKGGKIDGTDARHVVAIVVAMWQTEAGRGPARITAQDIMEALYESKMAIGTKGRAGADGLINKGRLGISISENSITMNGRTMNLR